MTEYLFFAFIFIIFYAYLGYGIVLAFLAFLKSFYPNKIKKTTNEEPSVSLLISCYNEMMVLPEKLRNCRELDYPQDKLQIVFVTDGSDDGSEKWLEKQTGICVYHQAKREGKTAAINRAMTFISNPIVVYSDANTILNKEAIKNIISFFSDETVGCVAGEKRIRNNGLEKAAGTGENFYWRYESFIKKCESSLSSSMGAAGELYAIRKELFQAIPEDTILDDFVTSVQVIPKGYTIKYAPNAYSIEKGSASMNDEYKRKIRIAAGAFQALFRNPSLLNPFRYGMFTLQYISHKVLRWLVVPFAFILVFLFNIILMIDGNNDLYSILLILQILFYLIALLGFIFRDVKTSFSIFFLPFYLVMMNLSQIMGLHKYLSGKQAVTWEKVVRE